MGCNAAHCGCMLMKRALTLQTTNERVSRFGRCRMMSEF